MNISSVSGMSMSSIQGLKGSGGMQGPPPPPKVEEFDSNGDELISADELLSFSSSDSQLSEVLASIAENMGDESISYEELRTQLEANKPEGPPPPQMQESSTEEDSLFSMFKSYLEQSFSQVTSLGYEFTG